MRVSASLVSPPQPRRRADVLPERVWRQQQLLARRLRRGATPLSQPCASCAPICALFRTRPTLVGEDRPSSASRASSGASLSSDGASPMLPPAPASQPARGQHRRPHALTLVVGAVFLRGPVDMGRCAMAGLIAGHTGPSAYWPLRGPVCPGTKSRRRGRCAQPVRPACAWFRSPSRASLTNSSATVYVAGVLLGLGSLGVGGNRRLAVALVSFRCLTCLFDGCLTIV